jgi:hypothetical protein
VERGATRCGYGARVASSSWSMIGVTVPIRVVRPWATVKR